MKLQEGSFFYVWKDFAFYFGKTYSTKRHSHFYHQLCLSVTPFRLRGRNNQWVTFNAAFIPSGNSHETEGNGSNFIMILLDPVTFKIDQFLEAEGNMDYPGIDIGNIFCIKDIVSIIHTIQTKGEFGKDALVVTLKKKLQSKASNFKDERIVKIINALDNESENISLTDLSAKFHLSNSRIRHFFKEKTGISISGYKLWLKIKRAIAYYGERPNLIEAAYEGGFSDQAHFSRIFKRSFGLSPKEIKNNSNFIVKIFNN